MRIRPTAVAWAPTDRILDVGVALLLVGGLLLPLRMTHAATGDPVLLNEMLVSHAGADTAEYLELYGTPGHSLAGLSLVVVEGDSSAAGTIDLRVDFAADDRLGGNGFFLVGNPAGLGAFYDVVPDVGLSPLSPAVELFENGSQTVALVATSSLGAAGTQVTGSEVVLDAVGLQDAGFTETFFWDAPVFGPVDAFLPSGARRAADGVDTDTAADWLDADFNHGATNTPTPATAWDEPATATCGADVVTTFGIPAGAAVSATDPDGLVGSFALAVSPDPGTVTLGAVSPSASVGEAATTTVEVGDATPVGTYEVTVTAATTATPPQLGTCDVAVRVDPAPEPPPADVPSVDALHGLLHELVADGSMHPGKAGQLTGHLDRAAAFAAQGRMAAAVAQLQAFTNQALGLAPRWLDSAAANELAAYASALAGHLTT